MSEIAVSVGSLRWPVSIVREHQTPSMVNTGNDVSYTTFANTRANILPAGAMAYWGAIQTGEEYTHRIQMRWIPALDKRYQIHRTTILPNGETRVERFQILRIKELNGRNRFVEIEAKLIDAPHS